MARQDIQHQLSQVDLILVILCAFRAILLELVGFLQSSVPIPLPNLSVMHHHISCNDPDQHNNLLGMKWSHRLGCCICDHGHDSESLRCLASVAL